MKKALCSGMFYSVLCINLHKGDTVDPYDKSGQKWIHCPQILIRTDTIHQVTTMLPLLKMFYFYNCLLTTGTDDLAL